MNIDARLKTAGTLGGLALVTLVAGLLGTTCGGRYPGGWTHDGWPLVGKHAPLTCEQCHPQSQGLVAVAVACASCHEEDRPADHYPGTDCGECHTPEGWELASVDHSFFPLTFSHDLSCDRCHVNGTYQGLDPTCSSCHESDRPAGHYEGTDCVACHTWTTWGDATVDHSFFPLTYSHDLPCEQCHTGTGYEGLDPACTSCHEDERPAGHYAGECSECHTWTSWDAATWEHTFRVPHEGYSACEDCHTAAPEDYGPISCFEGCHEHDRADTDDEHDEVSGYSYDTEACLRCHPTGDE